MRDSLNPLNAWNNLRSVPSATIFPEGKGGRERFLLPELLLPFLSFSLFLYHPPRKPTLLSTIFSAHHPPRCHRNSPVLYINQRTTWKRRLIDRLTFDLPPCSSFYATLYLLSRKRESATSHDLQHRECCEAHLRKL